MPPNNQIIIEQVIHKGEKRMKLVFEYDPEIVDVIKQIPGRMWSKTMNAWHLPIGRKFEVRCSRFEVRCLRLGVQRFRGLADLPQGCLWQEVLEMPNPLPLTPYP